MQIKIIGILSAAVILLGVTVGLLVKRLDKVKTERDQAIEFSNAKDDSLQYFKNVWGRETARVSVLDLTVRNMRKLQSDERLAWIRQFESINKRLSNLESATRLKAELDETFLIPLVPSEGNIVLSDPQEAGEDRQFPTDSIWLDDAKWMIGPWGRAYTYLYPPLEFNNHNEWIHVYGTISRLDTVEVTVDVTVPIESVVLWEKKKLFGVIPNPFARKRWFMEAASPNPYVKITESTIIRTSKRKRR